MAHQSNESGQSQVYVRPFPDVDSGRWQISTDGGDWPVWNPADNELFFIITTGVMALAFEAEPTFTPGALTQLFERTFSGVNESADGRVASGTAVLALGERHGERERRRRAVPNDRRPELV